jgi:glycosyltransferase involved in cell wall biosynthesis
MKYDFSICIPARNEEFIVPTIENIIKNKRGKTEVIVVLDGYRTEIPDHPDVRVIYLSESIGQRAAQNKAIKLSNAKYVAKTDAHVAFSEGFDIELMKTFEELGENIVVAPLMKNLHAFDWKCMKCGNRWYQGPQPKRCHIAEHEPNPDCDGTEFTKRIVFKPRDRTPNSTSYLFDSDLHFQYFQEYKAKQTGDYVESMSLQGSFLMMTKKHYLELNISDESWGGWGSQGSETALKVWLSGGRVIINKKCWYAHLFRTQSGFSFPYPQSGKSQQKARDICNEIFKNNKWEHQIYPLSWLVERFWPVPKWTQEELDKIKAVPLESQKSSLASGVSKGILYFTDNELPLKLAKNVQGRIRKIAADKGMELVSSTRKPMDKMGKNIVVKGERSYLQMFRQILAGLELMEADVVFMAEHDVLYPPEHFDFTPTEHKFYYDVNWVKVHSDGLCVSWKADQVSGLCAFRQDLLDFYRKRIETYDKDNFDRKFEPLSGEGSEQWQSPIPYIDIRREGRNKNLTYNKREISHFRDQRTAIDFRKLTIDEIPGWTIALDDIF